MSNGHFGIVCWRLTSHCNRSCPFCYRPKSQDLDTKTVFKIIDKLAANGVRGIGITGGEPLSRLDIDKIFKHLSEKKISICLATNTDYYNKHWEMIDRYVTTVGIPIEGSTADIHDKIRGKGNFKHAISAIDKIYHGSGVKMYISTVLTKYNIGDLKNIEKMLMPYKDRIVYWKVYELIHYYQACFQSTDKCKNLYSTAKPSVFKNLGRRLGKNKFFYLSSGDRSGVSFLINPNGDAIVPIESNNQTKDFVIGNLASGNIKEIFSRWHQYADFGRYQCHTCALKTSCIKQEVV